jgi:2-C-methyl-D-erythritol 2,4-cyclodiphosphate synthase
MDLRIGLGFDVHPFAAGRKCIIGGVDIPHPRGLAGHSDADVLFHAVGDALLGSLALGDLGHHFPDTDKQYKNIDSGILLEIIYKLVTGKGYRLNNLDAMILAQEPKLAPHFPAMQANLCDILHAPASRVSLKATTTEHLGFVGRGEGIAAWCNVTVTDG